MFRELKEIKFKELKGSMTMTHQRVNTNEEIEIIEKKPVGILVLKVQILKWKMHQKYLNWRHKMWKSRMKKKL